MLWAAIVTCGGDAREGWETARRAAACLQPLGERVRVPFQATLRGDTLVGDIFVLATIHFFSPQRRRQPKAAPAEAGASLAELVGAWSTGRQRTLVLCHANGRCTVCCAPPEGAVHVLTMDGGSPEITTPCKLPEALAKRGDAGVAYAFRLRDEFVETVEHDHSTMREV